MNVGILGSGAAAKSLAAGFLEHGHNVMLETADMGKVEGARAIEPLCILWCIPGFLRQDWSHAFKLLVEK